MTSKRNVLFLLAHQDDEVFVAPRIVFERSCGATIRIVYLTTGAPTSEQTAIRNAESCVALERLSVTKERIVFLGTEFQIPDGRLVYHLGECLERLLENIGAESFSDVYAPAWEGGHQDHDAAFVIGLALAQRLGLERNFWQFYSYNGHRTPGRFFRVFHPLPGSLERRERSLKVLETLPVLKSILAFKSQKKTWIGLSPQTLLHFLFVRKEVFQRGSPVQLLKPPHEGRLLYERYNRMSYTEFEEQVASFQARWIAPV